MGMAIVLDRVSKRYNRQGYGTLADSFGHLVGQLTNRNPDAMARDFWALKDVSFKVQTGETVGIIGPNGAGKTTILKMLAGVTYPTKGKIEAQGRIAPLIQLGAGFHPELTGRENIYLNGIILGMRRRDIHENPELLYICYSEI